MVRFPRCLVYLFTLCLGLLPAVVASAPAGAEGPARIVDVRPLGGRQFEVVVYSAAMAEPITLWISHPGAGAPAPRPPAGHRALHIRR